MMEALQNEYIEDYFIEIYNNIEREVTSYDDSHIEDIEIDSEVDEIINELNLVIPIFEKEKTKVEIIQDNISEEQFSSGISYEKARYSIPFIGNKDFFKYRATTKYKIIEYLPEGEIQNNVISFDVTEKGKISGDKIAELRIKGIFERIVDELEKNFKQLNKEVEEKYIPELKNKIKEHLINLKIKVSQKNASIDNLNPFK